MDKEGTTITIDEIMAVNNPIMVMVLAINVAAAVVVVAEDITEVINNVAVIPCTMKIATNECKPIRNLGKIFVKRKKQIYRGCICAYV